MSVGPTPTNPAAPSPTAQTVILQPRESWFGRYGKWLLVALALCVMVIFGQAATYQSYFSEPGGPQEKFHSLNKQASKKIAVITVSGTIMEGDDFVKQQIDRIKADKNVVGAVLRVNSPGGTVTYSDYLLHHLREMVREKEEAPECDDFPLVVSMGSICASGGYYISMAVGDQEKSIYAEQTTWTGSIGVIIPLYDFSATIDRLGMADDSIASGDLKQMGSPTREMTEEERAVFQELVDQSFDGFRKVVRSGRPAFEKNPEDLDAVATGQVFTAEQAKANGLVDEIGFIEDAISRVAELAGVDTKKVRCVRYEKPAAALDALLGASATADLRSSRSDLRTLLELSAPRAYYLYSVWPTLLGSH